MRVPEADDVHLPGPHRVPRARRGKDHAHVEVTGDLLRVPGIGLDGDLPAVDVGDEVHG